MNNINQLFANNQAWVKEILDTNPDFFQALSQQQTPKFLWIGCSDSRVPANQITGLPPGEVFVHRNIANLMIHTDLNSLSVLQFAVDILKVEHIIVCGHYGCSGVLAALTHQRLGLVDMWLRHIKDVAEKHHAYLGDIYQLSQASNRTDANANDKHNKLCELNVVEQVKNTCNTNIVQDAWARGQNLTVHGIIYGVHNGLLQDLNMHATSLIELEQQYQHYLDILKNSA
jgi:carbonic anhydrase